MVSRLFFSSYPASGDTYQFGEAIRVEVVFDRAVTVSGNPQLALTIGSATRAAGFVGGSDTGITTLSFEYVVQAADRDLDGIGIAADALALNGGTITAAGGSGAADLTHAALPTDTVRKVDGGQVSTPAVSSIYFASTPANGTTYELGDTIRVTLQFDRAVTATGTPQVALAIGTRSRLANYHSSHARFLFFDYQVQAADLDSDGIGIAANALSLNGGSIAAAAADATAAELTHAAVAVTHGVDGSSVTTPAVSHVAFAGSPVNGDTYLRGETIGRAGGVQPHGGGDRQSAGGADRRRAGASRDLLLRDALPDLRLHGTGGRSRRGRSQHRRRRHPPQRRRHHRGWTAPPPPTRRTCGWQRASPAGWTAAAPEGRR